MEGLSRQNQRNQRPKFRVPGCYGQLGSSIILVHGLGSRQIAETLLQDAAMNPRSTVATTECTMLRFLMAIFFCLHGQPISASPQEASPAVKISVQELDSSLILGNDRNSRLLRIGVRVSVTNNSTQPIGFEQRQLQLLLQDHIIPTVRPEGAGSSAARILQPMQTTEQMISYGPLPYSDRGISTDSPLDNECQHYVQEQNARRH